MLQQQDVSLKESAKPRGSVVWESCAAGASEFRPDPFERTEDHAGRGHLAGLGVDHPQARRAPLLLRARRRPDHRAARRRRLHNKAISQRLAPL